MRANVESEIGFWRPASGKCDTKISGLGNQKNSSSTGDVRRRDYV